MTAMKGNATCKMSEKGGEEQGRIQVATFVFQEVAGWRVVVRVGQPTRLGRRKG